MKKVRFSREKLIISGNIFEYYLFDEPVRIDPLPQSKNTLPASRFAKEKKTEREAFSLYRSRKQLIRLANANVGINLKDDNTPFKPIFITFTFAENIQDVKKANYCFTTFTQRFNYELFEKKKCILKYIVSIEFQERGAVHYHAVYFNLPYRENLKIIVRKIWRHGHIKIRTIENDIHDVGNYLTKYITKEHSDSRLVGKKSYFSSKNLIKPATIKDSEKVKAIMSFIRPEEIQYEHYYDNPIYGPAYQYKKYNVKDSGFVKGVLDLFVKRGYVDEKL